MNYQNPPLGDRWADNVNEMGRADQIVLHLGNQIGGVGDADINSEHGLPRSVVLQTDIVQSNKDHAMQTQVENQFYSSKVNGSLNMVHGGPVAPDSSGLSQFVSPSITLFTPTRYQEEGNPDPEVRYPGRDSISMTEVNNTTVSKQIKNGLELVPQPTFSDGKMPSSDRPTSMVEDILGLPQSGRENLKNFEHDELERHPPLASRNITLDEVPSQLVFSQAEQHTIRNNEGTVGKKVTFGDLVRSSEIDEPENRGHPSDREPSANWNSKASATTTMDDPNSSYSPYLPPVLEEPSSSFSEAADDDPLPAIEGLQISGEAFPGQQLQACGYSINGTTSCNFEWVRHLEDGSFNYVDGAKQPNYLVTADDVETYLAIEVQPLDDRKRKGELVKVFANEHRKITCDPVMHNCIERTLYTGHASYKLSLSTGYLDIWEPATLAIKRDGYSIKCSGPSGVVVAEKFSSSTIVSIPYGSPTEFSIIDSQGTERILRVDANSTDISGSRDTIVLTLRLFILKVQFLLVIILPEHMWDMCKILYTMCMLGNPQKQDLNLITDPLIFSKSSRTDEK
ncbi:UNVERIFIED_CONTAM: hypothetical protein Sradi_6151900 [Sesamum radiatum]|uniref:Uncharacterized protein n=1 Tax=Sesamum radiatum TaxID=300843 RepID=A0AAW2KN16_SESRA